VQDVSQDRAVAAVPDPAQRYEKSGLADPDDIARMTRFWGDNSWRQVAWADSKQPDMFRVTEQEKQPNKVIAEAFRERLKKVARFIYVPEPLPMSASIGLNQLRPLLDTRFQPRSSGRRRWLVIRPDRVL
jgi:hypothetical protein